MQWFLRVARSLGWRRTALHRRSDLAEGYIMAGLLAVFLVLAPLAGVLAGRWAGTLDGTRRRRPLRNGPRAIRDPGRPPCPHLGDGCGLADRPATGPVTGAGLDRGGRRARRHHCCAGGGPGRHRSAHSAVPPPARGLGRRLGGGGPALEPAPSLVSGLRTCRAVSTSSRAVTTTVRAPAAEAEISASPVAAVFRLGSIDTPRNASRRRPGRRSRPSRTSAPAQAGHAVVSCHT